MTPDQLLFWLKGHFDLSDEPPSREAWGRIKAEVMNASTTGDRPAPPVITEPFEEFVKRHPLKGGCGCK